MEKKLIGHPYDDAMTGLELRFNRHIRRIVTILIVFVLLILGVQYVNIRSQARGMIQNQLTSVGIELDDILRNIETHTYLMEKFSEKRLEEVDQELNSSALKSAFIYESSKDAFELSQATSLVSFDTAGNIFGVGEILKTDQNRLNELNMALDLFDVQYYSRSDNHLGMHSFYLSSNQFFSVYPRMDNIELGLFERQTTPRRAFSELYDSENWLRLSQLDEDLDTGNWETSINGLLNNERSLVFNVPVYRYDVFKGIAGAELTVRKLEDYIRSKHVMRGRLYLVDDAGEAVVAWNYRSDEPILNTRSIPTFYESLEKEGDQGNWLMVNVGNKPFKLIYEVNEEDMMAVVLPRMAMLISVFSGLFVFILINRHILTNRFFKPAIKIYDYMRLTSKQKETSKITLPDEWEEWFSGMSDVLSLMAVSKSIPGAIIQIGYVDDVYAIQFLGEGLEKRLNDQNAIDHLLGKSIMELVTEPQRWSLEAVLKQSQELDLPVRHEFALHTESEEPVWLSLMATPRFDEQGNGLWDGILLDVSERKLLEEELSTEKQFVEDLLDTTGAVFSVRNRALKLVRFNESFLKLSGFTKDEIMTDPNFEKRLLGDDYPKVMERFNRVLEGDYPQVYENYWQNKNGEKRLLHWTNTALTNHLGDVEYVISTGIDITEKLEAEMALKRSEAKFRSIYDNLASGIGLVDKHGKYIEVNEKWTKLLGYTAEEAKNLTFMDLTHPSEKDISWDNFQAMINREGGGSYRLEKRYRRKDGEYIWCDLATSVLVDEFEPENTRFIGIVTDITARKRVEEQLFIINRDLEHEKNRVEKLAKDQKLLFEIFEVFKNAPSFDSMFDILTKLLPKVLNYDNIILAVKESKESSVYSIKDFKEDLHAKGQDHFLYTGEGIVGKVLKDKQLYVSNDLSMDPYYVPHNEESKSMICVPIMYGNFVWGILSLDSTNLMAFDEVHQEVLSILATHIALHMEEIHTKENLSLQAERLRVLHDVVKEMVVERDNRRIAKKIIDEKLFPYSAIYAYENNTVRLLASHSEMAVDPLYPEGLIQMVLKNKERRIRVSEKDHLHQQLIPIYFGDRVYGFFHLCKEKLFTESDNEIALIISEQLSLFWELNMLIERTEFEAMIDPLTAVWNRRYMINRLEQEDEYIYRYGGTACVALVDLGDFKLINDRYGHAAGDKVLTRTAEIIKTSIRKSDFVGRYGGDEFIVFFPNTTLENAELFMMRIVEKIMAIQIPDVKEKIIADYGIGSSPDDDSNLIGAINIADERMYHNKRQRKRASLLNP